MCTCPFYEMFIMNVTAWSSPLLSFTKSGQSSSTSWPRLRMAVITKSDLRSHCTDCNAPPLLLAHWSAWLSRVDPLPYLLMP